LKGAENALRESEAHLQLQVERMPIGCIVWNPEFRVMSWNPAAERIFGFKEEEAKGRHPYEFIVPRDLHPKIDEVFRRLMEGDTSAHSTNENLTADGRIITCEWTNTPLKGTDGQTTSVLSMVRDITERKRAEEAQRRSAMELKEAQRVAHLGSWTMNVATGKVTWSEELYRMLGLDPSRPALDYPEHHKLFTPESWQRLSTALDSTVHGGLPYELELETVRPDGKHGWMLARGEVVRDGSGDISLVRGIGLDITERKRAEAELARLNQELEERVRRRTAELQTILDTAPIGIAMTDDTEGRHIRGNPAIERMLGASPGGELSRGSPEQCAPYHIVRDGGEPLPEDLPMQRAARGEPVAGELLEVVRADGSTAILHASAAPLFDEKQQPRGAVGAFVDITDRKRFEEALRESEQRVRKKLDSILTPEADLSNLELADILDISAVQSLLEDFYKVVPVTTGVVDIRGKVLAVPGWQRICKQFHRAHPESCKNCTESDVLLSAGVAAGEFKIYKCKNNMVDVATPIMIGGQHMGNLYLGQFLFEDEPLDYDAFRAQASQYGFDEKDYLAALDSAPRLSREAVNACVTFLAKLSKVISQLSYSSIKLARSSTQLGRANAELEASNKELEAFTYSVSHDLRAPLRHISGFSKILTEDFAPQLPEEAQEHLQRIQDGTRRMGMLVDDLLNLARVGRRDITLQVTGLQSVVEEVIASLAPDIGDRQIEWKIGELSYVECDTALMRQVFQNLLGNAVKFTRPRPHTIIEIGQMEKDNASVIYVRDNGVGFSMKYADKLFGVFQRLHRSEDFEGTGVGLATVQRILHKHAGRIWAEAELDKGATFYFTVGNAEGSERKLEAALAGGKA
jgi:PAS domain S-box-containing protein